jgi:hypothetical protein
MGSPTWVEDRLVVADAAAYLEYTRTYVEPENQLFAVTLRFFDSEEALQMAKEDPTLFETPEGRGLEARAEELSVHAHLRALIALEISVRDHGAAAAVSVPKTLRLR